MYTSPLPDEKLKAVFEDSYQSARPVSDERPEVSADARYIVKHLWFIFVLLPAVLVLALVVVKSL